ncbi:malonic semialdehyde reductase [Actinotalea solisilvae]|uniref:malonic semialdehyde reductase n=1 Tax=Actinotalea solisilvae TaxID=2072922 RepID=UPI0018F1274D|nr:malonic semialdehyde reductase [Actinotalea solisilvae]
MTAIDATDTLAPDAPSAEAADVLDELFVRRRTPRSFAPRPVTDDQVAAVLDAVRWGPTAFNSSPLRVLLVRSPEARERLAAHMAPANRDRVLAAPLSVVVASDTDFHERLDVLAPHMAGARERFDADAAARERLARDNAWLQAGYLVVALRGVGLEVGPMSGMDAAGVDAEFFAGSGRRALMVLNLGWPADEAPAHPRAPRLAFDDVAEVA